MDFIVRGSIQLPDTGRILEEHPRPYRPPGLASIPSFLSSPEFSAIRPRFWIHEFPMDIIIPSYKDSRIMLRDSPVFFGSFAVGVAPLCALLAPLCLGVTESLVLLRKLRLTIRSQQFDTQSLSSRDTPITES